jgi:hypothetical protein
MTLQDEEQVPSLEGREVVMVEGKCHNQCKVSLSALDESMEDTDPHRTLGTSVYMLHEQGKSLCSDLVHYGDLCDLHKRG